MSLQFLRPASPIMGLYHEPSDDSRHVLSWSGELLLKIDSRLRVSDAKGALIGEMFSAGSTWTFHAYSGEQEFNTGVTVSDYHWTNLELAEVEVAKHILGERT